jgi:galactokinase
MIDANAFAAQFLDRFGGASSRDLAVHWAPGRVNLIGDHVDYCGGSVLPMPIQFGTTVAVRINSSGRIKAASTTSADIVDRSIDDDSKIPAGSWGRFVLGAIAVLAGEGISVTGADVLVSGDIPGSGLSSSASLSVALLSALTSAVARSIDPLRLALAAQRIEHEHVGVQCGLMDQAVIALAEPGNAVWFDCVDHRHRSIAIDPAISIVVVDTGRTRQLVHSAYNARLRETRAGAAALGVEHGLLGRLDFGAFEGARIDDPVVYRRVRHVVGEARRVLQAAIALQEQDWSTVGDLFNQSHASLRDDFEVSCPELDALADALVCQSGCYGARMTGAGFGGCVVALVDAGRVDDVVSHATAAYSRRFGTSPRGFVARSLGGVRSLDG